MSTYSNIAPLQLKAARTLVGFTQKELAAEAEVAVETLKRLEACGLGDAAVRTVEAVIGALRSAGVEMVAERTPEGKRRYTVTLEVDD